MNKLKKSVLTLVTVFIAFLLVACGNSGTSEGQDALEAIKERGELNVGTSPDYPPMEFYILDENGDRQIVGSDIDLAQAIADEIGVSTLR